MQPVNTVTLIENSPATEFKQAKSEVIVAGNTTGIIVSGHVLEAAVQVNDDRYLIFTTDDVIYEEFLTVTLISVNDGILESLQLGNEYSSGFFEKLSTSRGSFHFIGDAVWTIKVADSPRLRLPFFSDPREVKRASGLKTYMTIMTRPIPTSPKWGIR
ncbi:hypothetical protein HGT73_12505 [Rosenbergiella australiborealis]|uniref:Uncharacterized protein n=1 Tax=Rosenbergiella australiborealis TaxID=1544696 RepID=A0ABS5T756_9GAMM|nr:hypothetical protein [Rosenbergiella australiborealis]MBT0728180.1 hypothetical protein [Rosenbergiella australiborealis]